MTSKRTIILTLSEDEAMLAASMLRVCSLDASREASRQTNLRESYTRAFTAIDRIVDRIEKELSNV